MRLCGLVRGRRGHFQNTTPGADSRNRPPIFVGAQRRGQRVRGQRRGQQAQGSTGQGHAAAEAPGLRTKQGPSRKSGLKRTFCCVKLNASNNGQVARSFLPPQGRGSLQGFGGFLCRGATPGDGRRYYRHPPPSAGRGRRDGFSDKIENFFSISLRRPENLSRRRGST